MTKRLPYRLRLAQTHVSETEYAPKRVQVLQRNRWHCLSLSHMQLGLTYPEADGSWPSLTRLTMEQTEMISNTKIYIPKQN